MKIIDEIKKFVEAETNKASSKYGQTPFKRHFIPMVALAKKLAKKYQADVEIVEIAAWFHDVGSVRYGRANHHLTGAKIAEKKLTKLNYPKEKIAIIKKCILNHRGSIKNKRNSLEEQIIAEADALSNLEDVIGPLEAALVYEKLDPEQAKLSVRKKLQNKWKQLKFTESKKIAGPKYKAAMLLLD